MSDQPISFLDPPDGPEPRRPRLDMDPVLPSAPAYTGGPDARRPGYAGYAGGSGAPADGGVVEQVHLLDYVKVLYKRRWVAGTAFLAVFGLVTVYTFTATPLYEATAQVLIESDENNIVSFEQVVEEDRQSTDYYQTQYRLLESRALVRRTLDQASLWDHVLFNRPDGEGGVLEWLSGLWPSASAEGASEAPAADETERQSRAIDAYLERLSVSPVRNSRLVTVTFESPDASLSARVANAHAAAYIEQNLEFKFLASQEASDWLADRMGEQREEVEQSEQALQQYREQTGAVALEDRENIVVQRLADLNAAATRARTERIQKESVYNQIRALQTDRAALDTFPAILDNTFIQQLKGELAELQRQKAQLAEKLGERHPEMIRVATAIESIETRINAEIQKVVRALQNDYQAALANERSLGTALDQQRREAQELNRASIQYGALQRDAQSNRELFQGLLQRTRETDISADLRTNNIRVVDAAEPPRDPSSPNRRNNLALGLLGGLMLGVGLAFLFEYVDGRIKSPDEIRAHLGLPCLGMIPAIKAGPGQPDPLLSADTPHVFAEAIKAIRTNLLFSSAEESSKSVVVTSTGPGEGKTVVSTNLAIALAQAGQRVLLMDCDMRRPRVHTLLSVEGEPGLSNVMVGDAKASDAVQKTPTQNLWVLPAGKHPPNPAELLGSKRFREFTKNLAEHFDWIILDSPPVMAVTDAVVVAHHAHGTVFVVGAEMTHRGTARQALDQLDTAKARFFGVVLNRVNLDRNPYYYSQYYRKAYAQEYATK